MKQLANIIIEKIFGSKKEWDGTRYAFKELKEEWKKPKERLILIGIAIICFTIPMVVMYTLSIVQDNAQYCETEMITTTSEIIPSGHSWSWYKENYKDGFPDGWIIKCKFDIIRWWNER